MQSTMPKVRVAVIGAGEAGRAHAYGFRNLRAFYHPAPPEVQLVAAVDADRGFADQLCQRFEFDRAETSWEAVAEADDIDAVSVAIPNFEHLDVVTALLEAGKHVLCEKPLAMNATDAFTLYQAALEADVIHTVGFNQRHTPAVAAIRELVREGRIGTPTQMLSRYLADHGRDQALPFTWRDDIELAGGGSLYDLGSHVLDGARTICGDVHAVRGATLRIEIGERRSVTGETKQVTVDDTAFFIVHFDNGCVGVFTISRVSTGIKNSIGFTVIGTEGAATFDWERLGEFGFARGDAEAFTPGFTRVVVGPEHPYLADGTVMSPEAGLGHGITDTFVFKMRDFVMAVASGTPNPDVADFGDGYANSLVLDAVKLSAERGGSEVLIEDIRTDAEAASSGNRRKRRTST